MGFYIIIFFLLLLSALLKNKNHLPYIVFFISLVLISGLRGDDVGVDTSTYRSIFNYVSLGEYWNSVEPGWNFLNSVVARVGGNFLLLLITTSLLTLAPVFYVAEKSSPYMYLSIFCFFGLHFYCGAFNIMRQYMAISWVLFAYYLYQQDKRRMALLSWLFACFFHYSCFFAVIALFFVKNNIRGLRLVIYVIVAFVFGTVVNEQIIDAMTFSEYTNMAATREDTVLVAALTIILDVYMLFIAFSSSERLRNSLWWNLYALSIIIINATYTLHYGARVYSIFAITQIVFFPLYIKNSIFNNVKIPATLIIIYVSIQFWRMLLANANNIVPYELNYQELKYTFLSFML